MIAIFQISWRMWQWKNFENRPVSDEVMCRQRRLTFFGPPCMCNGGARTISQAAFLITVRLSKLLNQLPVSMSNWTISTSSRPTCLSHHFYGHLYANKTLQPGHVPWLAPPWRRHCIWGLGRNDPEPGADRPSTWGGTTAFGADVGRIDPGRIDWGADRPVLYLRFKSMKHNGDFSA